MNIDYISSMKRVGELTLSPKDSLSLEMNWDKKMTKEMQVDNRGRVYAICVDGVIEKLGGSSCVGGIAATFKWYMKGFNKGNSDRTFCCWNYMFKAINKGKKVEVYAVWAPLVETNIPTMTSEDRKQTRSNQKSMQAVNLFVCYDHGKISDNEQVQPYAICCYEISLSKQNILSRADLDTKSVTRPALCDFDYYSGNLVVARDEDPSALLVYSSKDHRGAVAGMIENGKTSCMCCVPAATVRVDDQNHSKFTRTIPNFSSYALVASMDTKSNRYSVDIYDAANKL